jgi:hypothetical protein
MQRRQFRFGTSQTLGLLVPRLVSGAADLSSEQLIVVTSLVFSERAAADDPFDDTEPLRPAESQLFNKNVLALTGML